GESPPAARARSVCRCPSVRRVARSKSSFPFPSSHTNRVCRYLRSDKPLSHLLYHVRLCNSVFTPDGGASRKCRSYSLYPCPGLSTASELLILDQPTKQVLPLPWQL